ncbi:MAG: hypothetical protein ABIX12_15290, partial [Rubrivivax sp.]
MRRWFRRQVLGRRWLCFIVLVFAFLGFGAGTLNLFLALRANVTLLAEHGWQAAMDGGAAQAIEILLSGVASMASYIVFKSCEYRL